MKIILIGYMGSGKSTIGKSLANKLNLPFVDLDDTIEREIGVSISDFFETFGELKFRRLERQVLHKIIAEKEQMILSTGGGTPCYGDNFMLMKSSNAKVFYLKASIKTLAARLIDEKNKRPLIRSIGKQNLPEFIGKHLFERNNFYSQADQIVEIDEKSVAEVTERITALL